MYFFRKIQYTTQIIQEINLFANYIEYDMLSIFHSTLPLLDIARKKKTF